MFDFNWSEIALIGVVALVLIGPKDLPIAIRGISNTIKKLRRMAGEFQGHVDELVREADLGEAKATFDELRGLNPRTMLQRAVDPDGAVRSAFADPFASHPVKPVMTAMEGVPEVAVNPAIIPPAPEAPAFIPPGAEPPAPIQPPAAQAPAFIPPAFIPPAFLPPAFMPPGAVPPETAIPTLGH